MKMKRLKEYRRITSEAKVIEIGEEFVKNFNLSCFTIFSWRF